MMAIVLGWHIFTTFLQNLSSFIMLTAEQSLSPVVPLGTTKFGDAGFKRCSIALDQDS